MSRLRAPRRYGMMLAENSGRSDARPHRRQSDEKSFITPAGVRADAGAAVRLRREQTPAPETPPTQTAATGGVDTSCKVYFPNDQASDLRADTVHITDAEATVTVAYAQAIVDQLIAHDALPKDSKVLAISKEGSALSLDMDEAFLAGLRQSGSTGESMYLGSLVNTFLDNFNCETVRVTVEGKTFSTAHADYDKPLQAFTF